MSRESILIRQASIEDLPTLLAFEQGIIASERPFDSTLKPGQIHYYDLAHIATADDSAVFVAEMDDEIVASGSVRIFPAKDYYQHSQYAHLGFMYVSPSRRGLGLNQRIMDAIKNWCSTKNIQELRLEVYPQNQDAIKAYKKAGFTENLIEMRLNLKDQAAR